MKDSLRLGRKEFIHFYQPVIKLTFSIFNFEVDLMFYFDVVCILVLLRIIPFSFNVTDESLLSEQIFFRDLTFYLQR